MIRIGIGGWNFAPWRGVFYPKGLAHAEELSYASSRLTSIEINSTFYSLPKPTSIRSWAAQVPDTFVFSIRGDFIQTANICSCFSTEHSVVSFTKHLFPWPNCRTPTRSPAS